MPKYISISDKSILFDGCPTAKLRNKYVSSPAGMVITVKPSI